MTPRKWSAKSPAGNRTRKRLLIDDSEYLRSFDIGISCNDAHWRAGLVIGSVEASPPTSPGILVFHVGVTDGEQRVTWYLDSESEDEPVIPTDDGELIISGETDWRSGRINIKVNYQEYDFEVPQASFDKACLAAWGDGCDYRISIRYGFETDVKP
jgi:hypothetical protein